VEEGCRCAEIQAADETRHFRGCPLRELHPEPKGPVVDAPAPTNLCPACRRRALPEETTDRFVDRLRFVIRTSQTVSQAEDLAGKMVQDRETPARNVLRASYERAVAQTDPAREKLDVRCERVATLLWFDATAIPVVSLLFLSMLEGVLFEVVLRVPDRDKPSVEWLTVGRAVSCPWVVLERNGAEYLVGFARETIANLMAHEVAESLFWNGQRVFDPHALPGAPPLLRAAGVIHVSGPKQDSDQLLPDEALCEAGREPAPGIAVVFHPRAVRLSGGGFACPDCGESSRPAEPA
jgi:hypothetical protein